MTNISLQILLGTWWKDDLKVCHPCMLKYNTESIGNKLVN